MHFKATTVASAKPSAHVHVPAANTCSQAEFTKVTGKMDDKHTRKCGAANCDFMSLISEPSNGYLVTCHKVVVDVEVF